MKKYIIFILLTIASTDLLFAQTAKYLIVLKDKTGTPFTIDKPEAFLSERAIKRRQRQKISIVAKDLPVNPSYVNQLQQTGATVWYTSKWLNAVLVQATDNQLATIKKLTFVKGVEFNRALSNLRKSAEQTQQSKLGIETLNYGASLNQIQMLGVNKMHDAGYAGRGMLVALLDAGFKNANTNKALAPIFADNRVITTYDFVKRETSVYEDHEHGNNVFSIMASFQEQAIIGPAYGASFILYRTEDDDNESRLEEANWLFAAERADSAGVDIVQSSLGYTTFDNPADDYTYADMNGRTTLITRAADWAAATGMVVVVSAGNEGNKAWRYISAPADADSVLAIGAVSSAQTYAAFSSLGPAADGRVKPDVCAQGLATVLSNPLSTITAGNGTSYSAPLIAGLVTAFWQAHPYLTAMQVIDCIRKAGDRYNSPTSQFGYGIPTFERAVAVAQKEYPVLSVTNIPTQSQVFAYPNPVGASKTIKVDLGNDFVGNQTFIQLIDQNGRQLLQYQVLPVGKITVEIPLPQDLKNGLYYLKITDTTRQQTLKIVKE